MYTAPDLTNASVDMVTFFGAVAVLLVTKLGFIYIKKILG